MHDLDGTARLIDGGDPHISSLFSRITGIICMILIETNFNSVFVWIAWLEALFSGCMCSYYSDNHICYYEYSCHYLFFFFLAEKKGIYNMFYMQSFATWCSLFIFIAKALWLSQISFSFLVFALFFCFCFVFYFVLLCVYKFHIWMVLCVCVEYAISSRWCSHSVHLNVSNRVEHIACPDDVDEWNDELSKLTVSISECKAKFICFSWTFVHIILRSEWFNNKSSVV